MKILLEASLELGNLSDRLSGRAGGGRNLPCDGPRIRSISSRVGGGSIIVIIK